MAARVNLFLYRNKHNGTGNNQGQQHETSSGRQ
jgi:hypothetical protein